jgi:hypothetical protein
MCNGLSKLNGTGDSNKEDFNGGDRKARVAAQKQLIEELKAQWKLLWSERFDDRVRAEGVSINDYAILDVEKGTIIHATKDFKILNLKQILEKYKVENPERYVQPDVHVGGWNKFIKTEINSKTVKGSRTAAYIADKCPAKKGANQQSKKGGRGWLHAT